MIVGEGAGILLIACGCPETGDEEVVDVSVKGMDGVESWLLLPISPLQGSIMVMVTG